MVNETTNMATPTMPAIDVSKTNGLGFMASVLSARALILEPEAQRNQDSS